MVGIGESFGQRFGRETVGFGSFWRYFGREKGRKGENGCWEDDGLAGGFREKIVAGGEGRGKVLLFVVSWLRNGIIFGD